MSPFRSRSPRLRLPWQRGSSAHTAAIYPFAIHPPLPQHGPLVGIDMLSGDGFCWDPFEAYRTGLVSNPNVAVFGLPGQRKSTLVKTYLARMFAVYRDHRWVGIADPKGEYTALADYLGLDVIRLAPGGTTRINPLSAGPAATHEDPAKTAMRRADNICDLLAAVLRRDLTTTEEAVAYTATETLVTASPGEVTLGDLAGLLASPTADMADRLQRSVDDAAEAGRDLYYAAENVVSHSLRGMFDGPSTIRPDPNSRGVVIDMSGLEAGSKAMPLVLMAATAWLQEFVVSPGPQRIQVVDELWIGAGDRHFIAHMQRCQKLGRTFGVANLQIAHKVTDAAAQADTGTAASKIAAGLLADAATKIVLRQDPEQLDIAQQAFGLTDTERHWIGTLVPGRALWMLGDHRAIVQHHLTASSHVEQRLVDTDQKMRITEPGGSS